MRQLMDIAADARRAKYAVARLGTNDKNRGLLAIADALLANTREIIDANRIDIENGRANGLVEGLIDRLMLDEKRIAGIAEGCRQVAALPDPIGEVLWMRKTPNGLNIGQKRVPMGVIGIIYEARPNVTVDAAALCFKAGSACILRGGKEAFHSSMCLTRLMRAALAGEGLPEGAINLVEDTSRDSATQMMKLNGWLDVLIPRGGAGLIQSVVRNATVPVIETGTGNCHIYVDASADLEMAKNILVNAKCQRPSVCNAAESLLIHRERLDLVPAILAALKEHGVKIHGDATVCSLDDTLIAATEEDYYKEYLDYEISIKCVDSLQEAVDHINTHHTRHSDAILSSDPQAIETFMNQVDAACVYANASTRFSDGNEFGFGAEIGISTQKLHARGPMGLNELTTYKYQVYGKGTIRR